MKYSFIETSGKSISKITCVRIWIGIWIYNILSQEGPIRSDLLHSTGNVISPSNFCIKVIISCWAKITFLERQSWIKEVKWQRVHHNPKSADAIVFPFTSKQKHKPKLFLIYNLNWTPPLKRSFRIAPVVKKHLLTQAWTCFKHEKQWLEK